jgi:3D (Asp-Asp-Asp) domain-containing protein
VTAKPTPPFVRRRRKQKRQRIRIAVEILVGAAAIWIVSHPRTMPEPPQAAAVVTEPSIAAGGGVRTDAKRSAGIARPNAAASRFRRPAFTRSMLPQGHLFRSIEERARAGERIAVSLTAYCLQGRTRRGNLVRNGIIAVDRTLFPLGQDVTLYLGGKTLGRYLADDTGGAIKGARIDVWMEDCTAAKRFGRRRGYAQLVIKAK